MTAIGRHLLASSHNMSNDSTSRRRRGAEPGLKAERCRRHQPAHMRRNRRTGSQQSGPCLWLPTRIAHPLAQPGNSNLETTSARVFRLQGHTRSSSLQSGAITLPARHRLCRVHSNTPFAAHESSSLAAAELISEHGRPTRSARETVA